jgi:hypothetical protein
MTSTSAAPAAAGTPKAAPPVRKAHSGPGGQDLGKNSSREAQRRAAVVLEVLAGARTPNEAAQALAVLPPRYYQLESQALRGLLLALEPIPPGQAPSIMAELAALRRDKARLEREVLRQQALVRAGQRTIGLSAPPPPRKTDKKTRVRRKARALHAAARLQEQTVEPAPAAGPARES